MAGGLKGGAKIKNNPLGPSWDSSFDAPTQDAVYDAIQGIMFQGVAAVTSSYTAAQDLSALQVVYGAGPETVDIADNGNLTRAHALGLTMQAAPFGTVVRVREFGRVEDAFFNYVFGAYLFLGLEGAITSTPPASGYRVLFAKSLGAGGIFVNPRELIVL